MYVSWMWHSWKTRWVQIWIKLANFIEQVEFNEARVHNDYTMSQKELWSSIRNQVLFTNYAHKTTIQNLGYSSEVLVDESMDDNQTQIKRMVADNFIDKTYKTL